MNVLRSLAYALSLALAFVASAQAQSPGTPASPPAGLSQQQFDSLVDAISSSVSEKLKADQANTPAAAPDPAPAPAASSSKPKAKAPPPKIVHVEPKAGPDPFVAFIGGTKLVVRALPDLGNHLSLIPSLLDQRAGGGRGTATFLLLLGAVVVVAVAAEAVLRQLLHRLRARLASSAVPENGTRSLLFLGGLAVLDGLGVLVVWLVCNAATGAWFAGTTGQERLAAAVLAGIFSWRLYVLLFRVVLQPELPAARPPGGNHEGPVEVGLAPLTFGPPKTLGGTGLVGARLLLALHSGLS